MGTQTINYVTIETNFINNNYVYPYITWTPIGGQGDTPPTPQIFKGGHNIKCPPPPPTNLGLYDKSLK